MPVAITRTANPAGVNHSANVTTYSAVSIGTAAFDRVVAVLVGGEVASDPQSATIDYGAGAVAMSSTTLATFGSMRARIFYLPVGGAATTATIAITWSAAVTNVQNHISVYSVTGAKGALNTSNVNTSTDMDSTAPLTTGSSTIPANGGMLAVAVGATDGTAKTWANLGEDLDEDAGDFRYTTAFSTTAGTATRTCTGGTNNEDGAMVWVVFDANASVERLPGHGNLVLSTAAPTADRTLNVNLSPARRDLLLSGTAPFAFVTFQENFLDYSEDFSQSYWRKFRASVSADATTAPDGTSTADKLIESTDNGTHLIGNYDTAEQPGAAGVYTFSVYLKAAERTRAEVSIYSDSPDLNNSSAFSFDLSSQTVTDSADFGADTLIGCGIEAAANGFYRCWVTTHTPGNTPKFTSFISLINGAGTGNYVGDGSSGLYVWGVQLNRGGLAAYVKTPGGAALSPSQGNLSLSTTAPTVVQTTIVTAIPATANLALSTATQTVEQTTRVDATPATAQLALSAVAPTVSQSAHVDASPASANLTISTVAPGVVQDIRRDPASANLSLSTVAPTVAVEGTGTTLSPAAADLTLTTVAPSRVTDERRDPASGNLALSTVAPAVTQGTNVAATPASANLMLSTAAPSLEQTTRVDASPAAAQLSLTTEAPAVTAGDSISLAPATANLALSTVAPSVVQDIRRDPSGVNLAISAVAPSVTQDIRRDPTSGSLNLSTVAPAVVQDLRRDPAAANLSLSTVAPSIAQDTSKQPATASLTLSTAAPSITHDIRRDPNAAQLTLTSDAPVVALGSPNLSPGAADLTLSSTAPTVSVSGEVEEQPNIVVAGGRAFSPRRISGKAKIVLPLIEVQGTGVHLRSGFAAVSLSKIEAEAFGEVGSNGAVSASFKTLVTGNDYAVGSASCELGKFVPVAIGRSGRSGLACVQLTIQARATGYHDEDEAEIIAMLLAA